MDSISCKKVIVHIEAQIANECFHNIKEITNHVQCFLENNVPFFQDGYVDLHKHLPLPLHEENSPPNKDMVEERAESDMASNITNYVSSLLVCDLGNNVMVSFWQSKLIIHCFRQFESPPEKDFLDNTDGNEELPATEQWELPNMHLQDLWESIIVDDQIKKQLLGYTNSSLLFSDASLNSSIITWNRMILLYGPPGTGKTSLCKALAQKLSIRHNKRYASTILIEINSHSLFSKWFSESGKLVMKLFDHVSDIADDEDTLVIVLIDEVESITATRVASGAEPGDAVRVVNAVLTSLDSLRRKKNVLILCTSNIVDTIDPAFRDRLDMQIHLGSPNYEARYKILLSCIEELMKGNIICPRVFMQASSCSNMNQQFELLPEMSPEEQLSVIAAATEGESGRKLRKLPLQTHALFIHEPQVTIDEFLQAMRQTLTMNL